MDERMRTLDCLNLLIDYPVIIGLLQDGSDRISMPDYLSGLELLMSRRHYEACILLLAWGALSPPVNHALTILCKSHLAAAWTCWTPDAALNSIISLTRRYRQ